jgi:phosphohistidine phosphatase
MAATIELYLVRHAIAAERGPKYADDRLRPLTPAGSKKFADSVPGLPKMDVAIDFVLTSPLVRARETAILLAAGLKPKPAVAETETLAPGGRPQAINEAIKTHAKKYRRLALVGHEPDLGELAARLIGARGNVEFKKGAICLIETDGATPTGPGTLKWMLTPKALRALAECKK